MTLQWLGRAQGFSVCTYDIPSTLPNAFSWGQAVCSISDICVLASGSIRSLTHPIWGCVSVCSVVYMHMGMHVCSPAHIAEPRGGQDRFVIFRIPDCALRQTGVQQSSGTPIFTLIPSIGVTVYSQLTWVLGIQACIHTPRNKCPHPLSYLPNPYLWLFFC